MIAERLNSLSEVIHFSQSAIINVLLSKFPKKLERKRVGLFLSLKSYASIISASVIVVTAVNNLHDGMDLNVVSLVISQTTGNSSAYSQSTTKPSVT